MIKTAFITKPKWSIATVGNDKIGICTLPRIKGLTAGEQKGMEECSDSLPDPLAEASLLAIKIQKLHGLPDKDLIFCLSVVSDDGWEEKERTRLSSLLENQTDEEIASKLQNQVEEKIELLARLRLMHWSEIIDLNRKLSKASRLKRDAAITALFKYRAVILLRSELEELIDSSDKQRIKEIKQQITRCENWSEQDTDLLHDEFKQALWTFIQNEMSVEAQTELTSEDVVKPLGAE